MNSEELGSVVVVTVKSDRRNAMSSLFPSDGET